MYSYLLRHLKVPTLRKIVFPTSVLFILTRPHEFLTRHFSLVESGIEAELLLISTRLLTDAEQPILCLPLFGRLEELKGELNTNPVKKPFKVLDVNLFYQRSCDMCVSFKILKLRVLELRQLFPIVQ